MRLIPGMVGLTAFLLLSVTVGGSGVSLGVVQDTAATATITEQGENAWTVEAQNTGSAPVHGRFHLAVKQNNTTTFTAWSDMVTLQPGAAATRTLAAPPRRSGDGTITFRYGAHTTPPHHVDVTRQRNASPLAIPLVRAYTERVRVGVDAPPGRTVFVTVRDGSTRLFAQQRVDAREGTTAVDVPVHPRLQGATTLHVTAHTRDGRYSYTTSQRVVVRTGIEYVFWRAVDAITATVFM